MQVAAAAETSVVFESPERLAALLEELAGLTAAGRQVVVAREMTKIHEEFFQRNDGGSFLSNADKNPTLSIMSVAWRATDYLVDELQRGSIG